jgi:hypothetical protein
LKEQNDELLKTIGEGLDALAVAGDSKTILVFAQTVKDFWDRRKTASQAARVCRLGVSASGEGVTRERMVRNVMSVGWSHSKAEAYVREVLPKLKESGHIYSPKRGFYKAT